MKILLFLFCFFFSPSLLAVATIQLSIEQLLLNFDSSKQENNKNFQKLQLDQIFFELNLFSTPMTLTVNLSKIKLPEPFIKLTSLKLLCKDFDISTSIHCYKGDVLSNISFLSHTNHKTQKDSLTSIAGFSFDYDFINNNLQLSINGLKINNKGLSSLKFVLKHNEWSLDLIADNIHYSNISHYFDFYLPETMAAIDVIQGQLSFSAHFAGTTLYDPEMDTNNFSLFSSIKSAGIKASIKGLNYNYGENLAENLAFNLALNLKKNSESVKKKTIKSRLSLVVDKVTGEIIQNDIYINFNGNEKLQSQFDLLQNQQKELSIFSFSKIDLLVPGVIHLKSSGKLALKSDIKLKSLKANIKIMNYKRLNELYLNNILEGTDYEGFEISGQSNHIINVNSINGNQIIDIKSEINSLSFLFKDVFSFKGLNGNIFWNNTASKQVLSKQMKAKKSNLSWESVLLNNLPLGKSKINFIAKDDSISLYQGVHIPIFDGELQIDKLDISHIGQSKSSDESADKNMTITFNGLIKPISLNLISQRFDWPILDGKLSAVIPTTSYNEEQFKIGGAIMLQVFDGFIILKDLEIENSLQDYARIEANIDLKNLNLKSLTKTYDFGEIQGRIEGSLSNLVLQSWQPVAFNAVLKTPKNDKSKHRISQRAIDNLSSLGGVSGLLSRSFLGFFKTFSYNKIGLSCRLKNNICTMAGVERKGDGYYIVKGGGIPRIDVMGFQERVNWEVLVSRLKAIQSANQAVIQ